MKIILENEELDIIADIATREGLDVEQLYNTYEDTMASNFEQDIHDLASELAAEQHAYEETSLMNDKVARKTLEYDLGRGQQ